MYKRLTAKSFSKDITSARFKMATNRKMGRNLFNGDIASAWTAGALTVLENLKNRHKKEAYMEVDVMYGDIVIMITDINNRFNTENGKGKMEVKKVEDFI